MNVFDTNMLRLSFTLYSLLCFSFFFFPLSGITVCFERTGKGKEVIALGEFKRAICLDEDANNHKHWGLQHSRQN